MVRILVVGLLAAGCGPQVCSQFCSPEPMSGRLTPLSNSIYFWQVKDSTLEWGKDCADAADFRMSASAVPIGMDNYLIYKVDEDGKTAKAQTCTMLNPMSCKDSDNKLVFSIAGNELSLSRGPTKAPLRVKEASGVVRDSTCLLTQLDGWTVRDQGKAFELEVNATLDLEDTTGMECKVIEDGVKARSSNGSGIRGCVLTFKLSGLLR